MIRYEDALKALDEKRLDKEHGWVTAICPWHEPEDGRRITVTKSGDGVARFTAPRCGCAASDIEKGLRLRLAEKYQPRPFPANGTNGHHPPAERPKSWHSAKDLMAKKIEPLRWVIPGILPEGLSVFGGRPKAGKSWGIYGIGIAVATGGKAFGKIDVPQGEVLYLALEDGERRLQDRMASLLKGEEIPDAFDYSIEWPKLSAPGQIVTPENPDCLLHIEQWLDDHPKARLVVVDTLARVRRNGKGNGGGNAYSEDYEAMAPIQRLAVDRRIGLVLVTHTRKPPSTTNFNDFLDEIQGSTGITGTADTILALKKTGENEVCLFVRGRDVDEQELVIRWDEDTCDWTLLGEAQVLRRTELQKAALQVLRDADGPVHYRVVAAKIGKGNKEGQAAVQSLLHRLAQRQVVVMSGEGFYSVVRE